MPNKENLLFILFIVEQTLMKLFVLLFLYNKLFDTYNEKKFITKAPTAQTLRKTALTSLTGGLGKLDIYRFS